MNNHKFSYMIDSAIIVQGEGNIRRCELGWQGCTRLLCNSEVTHEQ
jgi:hypothetical protein